MNIHPCSSFACRKQISDADHKQKYKAPVGKGCFVLEEIRYFIENNIRIFGQLTDNLQSVHYSGRFKKQVFRAGYSYFSNKVIVLNKKKKKSIMSYSGGGGYLASLKTNSLWRERWNELKLQNQLSGKAVFLISCPTWVLFTEKSSTPFLPTRFKFATRLPFQRLVLDFLKLTCYSRSSPGFPILH